MREINRKVMDRVVVAMVWPSPLLLVLVVGACLLPVIANAQGPAIVRVEAATEESVRPTIELVGTVMPLRRSTVGSAVDGRVVTYEVDAGQIVQQDQTLATLLINTINIEIAGAEAELAVRMAERDEMVNGARPEELDEARADLASARAIEAYAKARFDRLVRLAGVAGALSQEELDAARSAYDSAEQRSIAAASALALLEAGTRAEQLQQAKARVEVQSQVVELLKNRRSKYTIKSPFAGFVVREFTEKGAWIKQGDPIAEVIDISSVEVEVAAPEQIVPFLRNGDEVQVRLDTYSDQLWNGTISGIIPDADVRARTFPVRVRIANGPMDSARLLRPGMLARVSLPAGELETGITLPKDAVVVNGQNKTVYKYIDGKVGVVPVTIVFGTNDRFLVSGQLQPGDMVVTQGNERLRPGAEVQILETK
jgi:multidrug efflux pump subunit AcrA (membrane-fusion protein)